jgi:hypothetical protein
LVESSRSDLAPGDRDRMSDRAGDGWSAERVSSATPSAMV